MLTEEKLGFKKRPHIAAIPLPINEECSQKCGYDIYEQHIIETEEFFIDTAEKLQKRIDFWKERANQTGRWDLIVELKELLEALK